MARTRSQEDKNIDYLESRYLYERRQKIYIANEETNQIWDETDIPDFIDKWNQGMKFNEIKEFFGMDDWEFKLVVADLLSKRKIDGKLVVFRTKGS